jgi:membrane-associated protein
MPEYLVRLLDFVNNLPAFLRLFMIMLASAIEYVFPIFPGDTVVLFAGFLSAQAVLGIMELFIAVLIGTLLGCLITYALGRAIAEGRVAQHWVDKIISKKALAHWHTWFNRWGYFLILANRFFIGIRPFFFVAAGMYKLPLAKVLICGAISAIIFNGCIMALGYFLGNNFEVIMGILNTYSKFVYVILGLIVLVFIAIKSKSRGT